MIGALARGTPVIALRRGSVPEVLDDGRTGFIADDLSDMGAAVKKIGALDPRELRAEVEKRFTPERLVDGYLAAYGHLLESKLDWLAVSQETIEPAPLTVATAS